MSRISVGFALLLIANLSVGGCGDCGGGADDDAGSTADADAGKVDGATGHDSAAGVDSAVGLDSATGADTVVGSDAAAGLDAVAGVDTVVGSDAAAGLDSAAGVDSATAVDAANGVDSASAVDSAAGVDAVTVGDAASGADVALADVAAADVTTCVNECPVEDAFSCAGDALQRCTMDGEGCLVLLGQVDCATSGEVCVEGQGGAACRFAGPGCEITENFDSACDFDSIDGDRCTIRMYDVDGNEVGERHDAECDGLPPFTQCQVSTRDSAGHLLTAVGDTNCDGEADHSCETYTYNAQGWLETFELDEECDGASSIECERYTYDSFGNRTLEENDQGCDGSYERCVAKTFDAKGNELTSRRYGCESAVYLACVTYTYNATGQILTAEHDSGCDGVDTCTSYTRFSVVGRGDYVIEERDDCQGNDCVAILDIYNGDLRRSHGVYTGCGVTEPTSGCMEWSYDARGNVTQERRDMDCDDVIEECVLRSWTSSGALMIEQVDQDCDGTADGDCLVMSYEGDCLGMTSLACEADEEIRAGDSLSKNNLVDGAARLDRNSCVAWPTSGSEVQHRFYPPAEGCEDHWLVTATLSGLSADLDLFLLGSCDPDSCLDASTANGIENDSLVFEAEPGDELFLVVDSYGAVVSDYHLSVTVECAGEPRVSCEGICGYPTTAGCSCDSSCVIYGNCCHDFCDFCTDECFWQGEECGGIPPWGCCDGSAEKRCEYSTETSGYAVVTEECSDGCGLYFTPGSCINTGLGFPCVRIPETFSYACGGEGVDPSGVVPRECPAP